MVDGTREPLIATSDVTLDLFVSVIHPMSIQFLQAPMFQAIANTTMSASSMGRPTPPGADIIKIEPIRC